MKQSEWFAQQPKNAKASIAMANSVYNPRDTIGTLSRNNALKPFAFQSNYLGQAIQQGSQSSKEKGLVLQLGQLKHQNKELQKQVNLVKKDKVDMEYSLSTMQKENDDLKRYLNDR